MCDSFLHISTSQLFVLACYEISFSPIAVFFFLLSPSLRQHTVYWCHYSSEEKGHVQLMRLHEAGIVIASHIYPGEW